MEEHPPTRPERASLPSIARQAGHRGPEKSAKKVSPALWWGHRPTYNPHERGDRRSSERVSRGSPNSHCPMSVPRHFDVGMNPKRETRTMIRIRCPRHLWIETTSRRTREPQPTLHRSCTMRRSPRRYDGGFFTSLRTHSPRRWRRAVRAKPRVTGGYRRSGPEFETKMGPIHPHETPPRFPDPPRG